MQSYISMLLEHPADSQVTYQVSAQLSFSFCLSVCLCGQRTLSRQEDVLSTVQLDVQQVSRGLGPGLEELEQLRKSLDAVIQEVSAAEALREHLGNKTRNQLSMSQSHMV